MKFEKFGTLTQINHDNQTYSLLFHYNIVNHIF